MTEQRIDRGWVVNPEMVTLAREAEGLTQSELAKRIDLSQGHLSKIESGLEAISAAVLNRLSDELRRPFSFFCQSGPIYGPSTSEFFHRKRQSVSIKLIRRAHAQVNVALAHISRLLRAAEIRGEGIERYYIDDFGGSVDEIARAVRASWNLPDGPVASVIRAIENAGGVVLRWDFGTPKIDAISRWVPGLPPVFFLNRRLPPDRERWTLSHELAHMVLHHQPTPEMEVEADRFAAEFLMPAKAIRTQLAGITLRKLASLKPVWRVSMAALLVRSRDLGRVTPRTYRTLWMQMGKAGYRRREPPELDFPAEKPTLWDELVRFHRHDLGYTLPQLAELLAESEGRLTQWYQLQPLPDEGRSRIRLIR